MACCRGNSPASWCPFLTPTRSPSVVERGRGGQVCGGRGWRETVQGEPKDPFGGAAQDLGSAAELALSTISRFAVEPSGVPTLGLCGHTSVDRHRAVAFVLPSPLVLCVDRGWVCERVGGSLCPGGGGVWPLSLVVCGCVVCCPACFSGIVAGRRRVDTRSGSPCVGGECSWRRLSIRLLFHQQVKGLPLHQPAVPPEWRAVGAAHRLLPCVCAGGETGEYSADGGRDHGSQRVMPFFRRLFFPRPVGKQPPLRYGQVRPGPVVCIQQLCWLAPEFPGPCARGSLRHSGCGSAGSECWRVAEHGPLTESNLRPFPCGGIHVKKEEAVCGHLVKHPMVDARTQPSLALPTGTAALGQTPRACKTQREVAEWALLFVWLL